MQALIVHNTPMAKQSQMYMTGARCIGLREYLKRAETRSKKVWALIKEGKSNSQIAEIVGVTSERVRQIRSGKA